MSGHGLPQGHHGSNTVGGIGGAPINLNNLGLQQQQQQQTQLQQLQHIMAQQQSQQRQQGLAMQGMPQPGMAPTQSSVQQPSVHSAARQQQPQPTPQSLTNSQMNALPIRSYLDQTVVPILLDGE